MIHVDKWVDDSPCKQPEGQKYARWFFFLARLAAIYHYDWNNYISNYRLFCTYEGKRYRVTGASRMGDIWLTEDFTRDTGYELRVDLGKCSDWSDNIGTPSWELPKVSLVEGDEDATLRALQELRKTPGMMVTVRAEDLACLMWKAHDTTLALNSFMDKTEFVQEEFSKKPEDRNDCFPDAGEVCGLHRGDMLRKWIDNLVNALKKGNHGSN